MKTLSTGVRTPRAPLLVAVALLIMSWVPAPAAAGLRMHGLSGVVNLGCLSYANDGGCATQSQYAIRSDGVTQGAASHTVGESSNPFYCSYYSAQSGQLPTTAAVNPGSSTTDPTYIRNVALHADNSNIPGCEPYYKVGPDIDTNLTPIDLYGTAGHPDHTGGMCYYDPNGGEDVDFGSGGIGEPAIVCHVPGGSSTAPIYYSIYGYDFSSLSTDPARHMRSGMLALIPQYGGGPTNITLTVGNVYFCNCDTNTQGRSVGLAAVVAGNAFGTPIRNIIFGNVYQDGGYRNRSSDTTGNYKFFQDHRTTPDGSLVSVELHDSYLYDLGNDPIFGDGNNGSLTVQDTALWFYCQNECHGEIAEYGTGSNSSTFPTNTIPLTLYKNLIAVQPATYLVYASGVDNTAPIYNNGSFHRVLYNAWLIQHVHTIIGGFGCSNTTHGYTPTNPCGTIGQQNGSAFIYTASYASLDFSNNVGDGTGADYCANVPVGYFYDSYVGGPSRGFGGSIVAGDNHITIPIGDSTFGPDANYFPNYSIMSGRNAYVNGNTYAGVAGFVDAYISGYGTASDNPTFAATLSGGNITLASAGNLLPGQHIYLSSTGADLGVIQSGGSGVNWTTSNTTASYPAGTQFKSLNPSSTCTPGMSRGCGTYTLSVTEPVSVPNTQVLMHFASTPTLTGSGNYSIGGAWGASGPGTRAWSASSLANPGPQNCT